MDRRLAELAGRMPDQTQHFGCRTHLARALVALALDQGN